MVEGEGEVYAPPLKNLNFHIWCKVENASFNFISSQEIEQIGVTVFSYTLLDQ